MCEGHHHGEQCGCGHHGGMAHHETDCGRGGGGHRHGMGDHCGCGGSGRGFHRRFSSRMERISDLETYLKDLEAEAEGAREALAGLKDAQ
ncbi:MAG: hypothetical protein M1401_04010 [Chloroflexi bacterium]|nr:hypothetical protein [Chloroflexota bacterium]MCL5108023.1 hypothetical protein [Chloroflexota bacterium]